MINKVQQNLGMSKCSKWPISLLKKRQIEYKRCHKTSQVGNIVRFCYHFYCRNSETIFQAHQVNKISGSVLFISLMFFISTLHSTEKVSKKLNARCEQLILFLGSRETANKTLVFYLHITLLALRKVCLPWRAGILQMKVV